MLVLMLYYFLLQWCWFDISFISCLCTEHRYQHFITKWHNIVTIVTVTLLLFRLLKHPNGRSSLVQVSPVFGFKLKPLHTQQRNLFFRLTFYDKDWLWEKGKYELRGLSDWKAFCGTIKTESVSALSICMRSHCQNTLASSSSRTVIIHHVSC